MRWFALVFWSHIHSMMFRYRYILEQNRAEMEKAAEAPAPTQGDGPTMEDMRTLMAEIQAGDEEVAATKAKISSIEKELAESKSEGGNIDDKLKRIRKAMRTVQTELEGVEKEAKKQEARNQDKLKKARKKYGGVAKVGCAQQNDTSM